MRLAWSCHRSMRRTRHALLMDNFRQATRDECTLTRAFSEKFVTVTLPCDEQAGRTAERPHEAPLVCAWAAQQKRTLFGGQGHRRENCGHSQSYVKIGGVVSSGFEVWRGPSFASGSTLQHVRFGSSADTLTSRRHGALLGHDMSLLSAKDIGDIRELSTNVRISNWPGSVSGYNGIVQPADCWPRHAYFRYGS